MRKFLVVIMALLLMVGCVQQPVTPAKEIELKGFVVKSCDSDACLKQWLKDLSDKPGCAVLGMSTTFRYMHANGGWYVHTVIAECPEDNKSTCREDGGVDAR